MSQNLTVDPNEDMVESNEDRAGLRYEDFSPYDERTYEGIVPTKFKTADDIENEAQDDIFMSNPRPLLVDEVFNDIVNLYEENHVDMGESYGTDSALNETALGPGFLVDCNEAVDRIMAVKTQHEYRYRNRIHNCEDEWGTKERRWISKRKDETTWFRGLVDYLLWKFSPLAYRGRTLNEEEEDALIIALQLLFRAAQKCFPSIEQQAKWKHDMETNENFDLRMHCLIEGTRKPERDEDGNILQQYIEF